MRRWPLGRKPGRMLFAAALLTCVVFVYLSNPSSSETLFIFKKPIFRVFVGSGRGDAEQQVLPDPKLAYIKDVRLFWKPFERSILASKPTVAPIQLITPYGNINAPEHNVEGKRKQPAEYVILGEEGVEAMKASHAQFRADLDDAFEDQPQHSVATGLFKGEGVVTVAGGEYFGPAIVGIKMLRQTGSDLPVEAFLANWDEYEPELCETVLPSMNAKCFVLTDFMDPSDDGDSIEPGHYQLKSLALLFSSFQHVLYLDSDSIPLVDPSKELFGEEPYRSTGLVGFPDFWVGSESPTFYRIAGMDDFPDNLPAASSEAGQLLVNKKQHLKALLLAAYYNIYGPDWYYPLLSQGALGQGDKCTFETAAVVLGQPWYRVKTPVKAVGRGTSDGRWRGSGMVQFLPMDDIKRYGFDKFFAANSSVHVRPAFLHANTPKMNAGHLVDEGDLEDADTGLHLRLWGDVKTQVDIFGLDLEMLTWRKLVEVGCELSGAIDEWKHRLGVCNRLKHHFDLVFGLDSTGSNDWNSTA